jgi:hypothetical protein
VGFLVVRNGPALLPASLSNPSQDETSVPTFPEGPEDMPPQES